jgi:magnesium-transporting ATPase (P-type)
MGFDLAYDIIRHIEDRKVNRRKTVRLAEGGGEETVTWQTLKPGDIVIVKREQRFPADLLFLTALPPPEVDPDADIDLNRCYVETSNIDGETNLKVRVTAPIPFKSSSDNWWDKLEDWSIEYDKAKPDLEFSGLMRYEEPSSEANESDAEKQSVSTQEIPVDFSNLLLRDSVLKNTHSIVGVVLYAGIETKGVQSSSATRSKVSNAMILINRAIIIILFVGLIMVLVSAGVSSSINYGSNWYLGNPTPYVFGPFWSSFFTYVILYSNLLPISLVIATTITNFVQAQFVNWDVEMYDETKDRHAKCATLELAQEIGQVSFLFSDKTGTLTRNEMKFVGCTLGLEHSFGLGETKYETTASDGEVSTIFTDLMQLVKQSSSSSQRETARLFLAVLSVCHTVLVEGHGPTRKYNAEGPDEEALVSAVAQLGFVLVKNFRTTIIVESDYMPAAYSVTPSGAHKFEVLGINHFDSTRKRMSIIVRLPNNNIELMVKGADSVIFERLAVHMTAEEERARARIGEHLDRFADNGLRTLVIAKRSVSEEELRTYLGAVANANAQLGEEKTRLIAEAADVLEHDLVVLGASAIEDRLQDGVPETLKCLREAGIKTWVLTGDKVETAVNIGYSSGLLTNDMQVVHITSNEVEKNLQALGSLDHALDPKSLEELNKQLRRGSRRKLFSPARKTRGVSLGAEASGEDPFGMGHRTRKVIEGVVENGFHRFTSAYSGGKRAWRSSIGRLPGRHSRAPSKELSEPQTTPAAKTSNLSHSTTNNKSPTGSTLGNTENHQTQFSFMTVGDASFETTASAGVDVTVDDSDANVLHENSFNESEQVQAPKLVRQTSAVIPPNNNYEASHLALVVSGAALNGLLHDPKLVNKKAKDDPTAPISDNELKFLSVAKVCKVVIACRVSPRQKALLVRLVRKGVRIGRKEPITLAVGDGQNDVAMIQESRVGVGVAGREGSQAVNAADFSIGQFRFLRRLLLVHGRWNYRRVALLVLFIFYAHILPVLVAFAYNFSNMWSGTTPFPFIWVIAYSYIVVIPCIIIAMFNRDINAATAFRYPSIYVSGRANLHMGRFKIVEYVFKAIAHATIICGFVYGAFAINTVSDLDLGTMIYCCVILVVLSRLALETYTWTIPSIITYLIALIIFPVLEVIFYTSDPTYGGASILFGPFARYIWAVVWFVVVFAVGFDLSLTFARRVFFPNLIDIVIETDRGYTTDSSMEDATFALRMLGKPRELPRDAVSAAVGTAADADTIPLAPKYRSAYAQDVPEGQNVADGMGKQSRFSRFSLRTKKSFTLRKGDDRKSPSNGSQPRTQTVQFAEVATEEKVPDEPSADV